MSKLLRIEYSGAWYHVMNRGRSGKLVVMEKVDHYGFIELLKETVDMWNMRVRAYYFKFVWIISRSIFFIYV
jgi:hypothetical protein